MAKAKITPIHQVDYFSCMEFCDSNFFRALNAFSASLPLSSEKTVSKGDDDSYNINPIYYFYTRFCMVFYQEFFCLFFFKSFFGSFKKFSPLLFLCALISLISVFIPDWALKAGGAAR